MFILHFPLSILSVLSIQLTCDRPAGVNAIKAALAEGERTGTPELPVECKVKATPIYTLETVTEDAARGVAALNLGLLTIHF